MPPLLCAANQQSLEVSYTHLSAALPILAVWTADVPKQMLEIYDRCVKQIALEMFSDYKDIASEMFVRIADLPIADSIRDLRCDPGLRAQGLEVGLRVEGLVWLRADREAGHRRQRRGRAVRPKFQVLRLGLNIELGSSFETFWSL